MLWKVVTLIDCFLGLKRQGIFQFENIKGFKTSILLNIIQFSPLPLKLSFKEIYFLLTKESITINWGKVGYVLCKSNYKVTLMTRRYSTFFYVMWHIQIVHQLLPSSTYSASKHWRSLSVRRSRISESSFLRDFTWENSVKFQSYVFTICRYLYTFQGCCCQRFRHALRWSANYLDCGSLADIGERSYIRICGICL